MTGVDPRRLIAALEGAGFQRVGGREGRYARLMWPSPSGKPVIVPLDPAMVDYEWRLEELLGELGYAAELGVVARRVLDGIGPDVGALVEASSLGTPDAVAMRERTSPEQARRVVARAHGGPCCDLHNWHCEPPGDLCCWRCAEASHAGPFPHADGTVCVLDGGGGG